MVVAKCFILSGRVQGVGFRFFVENQANLENLDGYVRNLDDGRLEIAAEGDAEAMVRFERAVRRGPAAARVDTCDVTDLTPQHRRNGFSIRL